MSFATVVDSQRPHSQPHSNRHNQHHPAEPLREHPEKTIPKAVQPSEMVQVDRPHMIVCMNQSNNLPLPVEYNE